VIVMQIPFKMVASQLITIHNSNNLLSVTFCPTANLSKLDYQVAKFQLQQNYHFIANK